MRKLNQTTEVSDMPKQAHGDEYSVCLNCGCMFVPIDFNGGNCPCCTSKVAEDMKAMLEDIRAVLNDYDDDHEIVNHMRKVFNEYGD